MFSILNKKILRTLRKSTKQYVALFLILTLFFVLFFGLVASYRDLKTRVEKVYKESNLTHSLIANTYLKEEDKARAKRALANIGLKPSEYEMDTRGSAFLNLKLATGFTESEIKSSPRVRKLKADIEKYKKYVNSGFIASEYDVTMTKKPIWQERISKSYVVYDHEQKEIKNPQRGVFMKVDEFKKLPRVGTPVEIDVPKKYLELLLGEKGYKIDHNTGEIVYKNGDLAFKGLERLYFDGNFESILTNRAYLKDQTDQNLPYQFNETFLSYTAIRGFLKSIAENKTRLKVVVPIVGYVYTGETIQKNVSQLQAFLDTGTLFQELGLQKPKLTGLLAGIQMLNDFIVCQQTAEFKKEFKENNLVNFRPLAKSKKDYATPNYNGDYFALLRQNYKDEFFKDLFAQVERLYSFPGIKEKLLSKEVQQNKKLLVELLKIPQFPNQINVRFLNSKNPENTAKEFILEYERLLKQDTKGVGTASSRFLYAKTGQTLFTNNVVNEDVGLTFYSAFIYPLVFFLVSLLIFVTTSSQLIIRESKEIGTMKAIGISRKQIFGHYLKINLLLVFSSLAVALIISPFIVPLVLKTKYNLLYNLPKYHYIFPWLEVMLSSALVILITSLILFLVIKAELKKNPVESMLGTTTNSGMKKASSVKRHFMIAIAFRNIKINLFRSLLTIVGVAGCTGLVIASFGIIDTINKGIDNDLYSYYNNVDAAMLHLRGKSREVLSSLSKLEIKGKKAVYYAEPLYNENSFVQAENGQTKRVSLLGISKNSKFYHPQNWVHRLGEKEVSVSKRDARALGLKVGDYLSFTILGETYRFKVAEIRETFFVNGVIFNREDCANELLDSTNVIYAKLAEGVSKKDITKVLNHNFIGSANNYGLTETKDQEALGYIGKVIESREIQRIISKVTDVVYSSAITLLSFAIILAIVVLYNLVRLNFEERLREIATLKVLGFFQHEIAISIFIEMLTLSLIGLAIGLALGYPFLYFYLGINEVSYINFMYNIEWLSYVFTIVLIVFVNAVLSFYMAFRVKKVPMVESLKSVE